MTQYIQSFLLALNPAFSYNATFQWFVIAFAGLILRHDSLGVTSIIRVLVLPVACYPNLLHFFHSSAWSTDSLVTHWIRWVRRQLPAFTDSGRIVLIGDHTKTPKDGRCIPAVTTLHQESETAGKPSFFRGHEWGCIAVLMTAGSKWFATPLSARIHNDSIENGSRVRRLIAIAGYAASRSGPDWSMKSEAEDSSGEKVQHSQLRPAMPMRGLAERLMRLLPEMLDAGDPAGWIALFRTHSAARRYR